VVKSSEFFFRLARRVASFAFLVALSVPWIAAPLSAEEWSRQWNVGNDPEIRLDTGDGSVTVVGVAGSSRVEARVITRGWPIGSSGVRIDDQISGGNSVSITLHIPHRVDFLNFSERSVRIELRVPETTRAHIHTSDGSIQAEHLRGPADFFTSDGSVKAHALDGSVDVHTGDGSVELRGRFDRVALHTSDGSIDFSAEQGSKLSAPWRLETGDGSVSIRIPSDLAADVDIHTGDGSLHCDLPLTVTSVESEHSLRGRLNGGGQSLSIRTGDGSVKVEKL
jgi:DUF4097 and DUF4098 domain-containing protein YvlB